MFDLLGQESLHVQPLAGGSLSSVSRHWLADGSSVAVKTAQGVRREANMLRRLDLAGLRVPAVISVSDRTLVLEDLGTLRSISGAEPQAWEHLGAAIAQLRGTRETRSGWEEDHAFGDVAIPNRWNGDWRSFWTDNRLRAPAIGLDTDLTGRVEQLACRVPDLIANPPKPSLLHGDLWSGNVLVSEEGSPILIDPACYFGDWRVDLAMMCLFADPPASFWDACPDPGPDWPTLCALYQLWPALVHLRLFGSGYRPMVTGLLEKLGL